MTEFKWINPKKHKPETFPIEGKKIIFKLKGEGISISQDTHIGHFEKLIKCENNKTIENGFISTYDALNHGNIYGIYFKGMPYIFGVYKWSYIPE